MEEILEKAAGMLEKVVRVSENVELGYLDNRVGVSW
ncbi:hypothetical protein ANAPH2_00348 [Anaplasma phagocytophilum]|nr:hypothetical protein ANAPH2_00348 [Anaplasma phagocytophilum]